MHHVWSHKYWVLSSKFILSISGGILSLVNNLHLVYDLVSCVAYKFQCGRCNTSYYGDTERLLKVRSGEYIGISPLTFRKIKLPAKSSIRDHFLLFNHDSSFDDFTILAQVTNKFLLEIKENLLIKCDKPILDKKHQFRSIIFIWQGLIWLYNVHNY